MSDIGAERNKLFNPEDLDDGPDVFQAPLSLNYLRFEKNWEPAEELPETVPAAIDDRDNPAVVAREWVRDKMEDLPREPLKKTKSIKRETITDCSERMKRNWYQQIQAVIAWVRKHPRQDMFAGLTLLMLALVIALAAVSRPKTVNNEEIAGLATTETTADDAVIMNARPGSGTVIYNRYAALSVSLTIENHTDNDIYVLTWAQGVTAQKLYIRAGTSATFAAPMGTYHVYVATGDSWQSDDDLFGSSTLYYTRSDYLFCAYGSSVTLSIPADYSGFIQYVNGWVIGH